MCLAINYGGRAELVDAVRRIADEVRDGMLDPAAIDEETISARLYTAGMTEPDLLIRTAGEMRVSNYLLWQISYAEIWVTDVCWPDFDEAQLHAALRSYAARDRRFGGSSNSAIRQGLSQRMEASTLTSRGCPRWSPDTPSRLRRAHLVGVAGSGMRALADVLAGWGWQLTGSDLAWHRLQAFGGKAARWFQGHAAEHLSPETELVVYSDAVPADNPELRRAAELGIPRAQLLPDARPAHGGPPHRGRGRHARKIDHHGDGRPHSGRSGMRSHRVLRGHALGGNLGRTRRVPM